MIMHQWTPSSPIPNSPMDSEKYSKQRLCLRWLKFIVSATIPILLIVLFLLYWYQEKDFFNRYQIHEKSLRHDDRIRFALDRYFDDVSKVLLQPRDQKVYQYIQSKTLVYLRSAEKNSKADVLRFLFERGFLQTGNMNFAGADFQHVEINCHNEESIVYLSNVIWSNGIIRNCRFHSSNFNGIVFSETHFINCSFHSSTFLNAKFDKTLFQDSILFNSTFDGASFVQADLLRMNILQGNRFRHVDFYRSQLTNDQFEGKYHSSIIPHDFHMARFPNGSFNMNNIDKNLLMNGDAEFECENGTTTSWLSTDSKANLIDGITGNLSGASTTWGNCSFVANTNIHLYQTIDLREYSLMIKTNNAEMTFSASTSCEKPFFHINLYRFDGIVQQTKDVPKTKICGAIDENQTVYCYDEKPWILSADIQSLRLDFGVESAQSVFPCYFDNIIMLLHPK